MSARLLDGRDLASHLRRELEHRVSVLRGSDEVPAPVLAILRDGASQAAALYAASLERAARSVGIEPRLIVAEPSTDAASLEELVEALNADRQVAGIVVAQPFADAAAGRRLAELIDPAKDVDGATPTNAGRLARGEPAFVPATALAVVAMLEAHRVDVAGLRAVIVGRSAVVGRAVASLLGAREATGVGFDRFTRRLAGESRRGGGRVAGAGGGRRIGGGRGERAGSG
jgi:methylenetetrahydrofolate dehydrogenase (NADP+)/methenyltetrahydrofolate cyclohydrolase